MQLLYADSLRRPAQSSAKLGIGTENCISCTACICLCVLCYKRDRVWATKTEQTQRSKACDLHPFLLASSFLCFCASN